MMFREGSSVAECSAANGSDDNAALAHKQDLPCCCISQSSQGHIEAQHPSVDVLQHLPHSMRWQGLHGGTAVLIRSSRHHCLDAVFT